MISLKRLSLFTFAIALISICAAPYAFAQQPPLAIKPLRPSQKASVMQTVGVTDEYWSLSAKKWMPGTSTSTDALWLRTTRIRQYSISDLLDNGVADTPLDGGTPTGQVHFKLIEVEVRSANQNVLGSGKSLVLRMLRAV